jgi:hypothetical protein
LSASCFVAFLRSCALNLAFFVCVATCIIGSFVVGSYVLCRLPSRRSLSLNTVEKLPLNPKSLPRLKPRTFFGYVTLVPVIFPKQTNFALTPFFSCA